MKSAYWQGDDWRIWRDRKQWPFAPQEYIFFTEAAEQLCKAWWGDRWLKPFHYDLAMRVPPPAEEVFEANGEVKDTSLFINHQAGIRSILGADRSQVPIVRETWAKAQEYAHYIFVSCDTFLTQRDEAVEKLHKAFAEGIVQTAFKDPSTVNFKPLTERAWWCERPMVERRIRTCLIDAANPFETTHRGARPLPQLRPLFITRQSLDAALVAIAKPLREETNQVDDPRASRPVGPSFAEPESVNGLRGTLPEFAKPSDWKHEDHAHAAAALVRARKVTPQAACAEVAPVDPTRAENSVVAAVRRAYDLMYDKKGWPLLRYADS